jgi:hypothetical protein
MMPMNTTAEIHQQNFGLISLFNFWYTGAGMGDRLRP